MSRLASLVLARLKPHLLCALALLWGGGILAADAYTFAAGTKIPLKESGATDIASWLTTDFDADKLGEYGVSENIQAGSKYFEFSLNNETQGSYYLSVSGYNASEAVTLTVTASGTDYSRSASAAMPKVASWNDQYYSDYHFLLDDLPAGNFTLRVTAKRNDGSSWLGYYKDFTLVKISEAPYKLTGEPYDLTSNSGTALALADGNTNGRLTITTTSTATSTIKIDSANNAIESTHSGDTIVFWLSCSSDAKCMFKYSASNNSGGTATVNWSLIGNGGNSSFSDSIEETGNWNTFADHEHDLGTLSAGKYILVATLSTSKNWAGNYKDFVLTEGAKSGSVAAGETLKLTEDTEYASLSMGEGATIDLNGFNLVVDAGLDTLSAAVLITNSVDETLSTVTIANPNNTHLYFGGNLRYVATGKATDFRTYDSAGTTKANTHTGGTVLSNLTQQIKFYGPGNFGMGNLVLAGNTSPILPSSNTGSYDKFAGIEVTGADNVLELQGKGGANSYDSASIKFTGDLSGDGELLVQNGWQPTIYFNGATKDFKGTLFARYDYDHSYNYTWWRGLLFERAFTETDGSASLENAAVVMTNATADARNRIYIAGNQNTYYTFPIGSLTTPDADGEAYTNTFVYTYKYGLELAIGARGESGTFAGNIYQLEAGNSYVTSVKKVGAGTWTLTGLKHNFGGTFTVGEGTVVFANKTATAMGSKVVVKSGAAIGVGGGTLTSPVEFENGAKVKLTNESTDTTYTILTAAAPSSGTPEVATDAEYSRGTWKAKWTTNADGSKTLTASFFPHGLIIILR